MAIYGVTLPIKGTIYIEVEADDEDTAIEIADRDCDISHVEDWEPCGEGEAERLDGDDEAVPAEVGAA